MKMMNQTMKIIIIFAYVLISDATHPDLDPDQGIGYALLRGAFTSHGQMQDSAQHAWGHLGFGSYFGGSVARDSISGNIIDVSAGAPSQLGIQFHSEMAYSLAPPSYIAFGCFHPAAEGGMTLIADTREVLRLLPAKVFIKLRRLGIQYIRQLGDKTLYPPQESREHRQDSAPLEYQSWQDLYLTDSVQNARAQLEAQGKRVEELPLRTSLDGKIKKGIGLKVSWTLPAFAPHPLQKSVQNNTKFDYLFMSILDFWGFPYHDDFIFAQEPHWYVNQSQTRQRYENVGANPIPNPNNVPYEASSESVIEDEVSNNKVLSQERSGTDEFYPELVEKKLALHATWGDGSEFTLQEIDSMRQAYAQAAVPIKLEQGDMIILDNYKWAHGRTKYVDRVDLGFAKRMMGATMSENIPRIWPHDSPKEKINHQTHSNVEFSESTDRGDEVGTEFDLRSIDLTDYVVSYHNMAEGTTEDYEMQSEVWTRQVNVRSLSQNIIDLLIAQNGSHTGALLASNVNLYEHGIQTATRAYQDWATTEMVVGALFHDIGEVWSPSNHGSIPAAILRPYVSPEIWWVLSHHEIFQGFYYFHLMGKNRLARDRWKKHRFYNVTAYFCHQYDQPSFDPSFTMMDLEEFRPMIELVFSTPPFYFDQGNPKRVAVFESS